MPSRHNPHFPIDATRARRPLARIFNCSKPRIAKTHDVAGSSTVPIPLPDEVGSDF